MNVLLNGERCVLDESATVASVLDSLGAADKSVAVVVNEEMIRPNQRVAHRLREGDRIEVLNFAGGG